MARKDAEKVVLTWVDKILPGSGNKELYENFFKGLNDQEFKIFMERLRDGTEVLPIIAPNESGFKLDIKRNFKLADELGVKFMSKITEKTPDGDRVTPIEYFVADLPIRRPAQTITKKSSIPENDKVVNQLTGQATGTSRGSKITYPEIHVAYAIGLDKTVTEFLKARGGDKGAYDAMVASIINTGDASEEITNAYATGVVSTQTLRTMLTAMHLKTTL